MHYLIKKIKFKKSLLFILLIELTIIFCLIFIIVKNQLPLSRLSVTELKKESLNVTPAEDLKYFFEPQPNTSDSFHKRPDWLEYDPKNTINSDSLNERFDYSVEKPENTFRIITLGDSLTFGLFVDTSDNYPEKLEDLLNNNLKCKNVKKFEVINLGVPSYDIRYTVERFKKRGVKYNPDLVLWFLQGGNFYKIQDLVTSRLSLYTDQKGNIAEKARVDILKELGEENILKLQTGYLKMINNYYTNKLVIFSLPHQFNDKTEKIVKNFLAPRKDGYFFQTETDFNDTSKKLLFPDHHPTAEGYTILSQELYDYLVQNKLISCN